MCRARRLMLRVLGAAAIKLAPLIKPGLATRASVFFCGRLGMRFHGTPNYLSARINFDGTDYSLIEICQGVTISSYVRVLTHDWSLNTIVQSMGVSPERPIGRLSGVFIGEYSFIGTGSVIMPGERIGRGCLIGAGTVVRGEVPDYSIMIGSPGVIVGDTRDFAARQLKRLGLDASVLKA
jgi:acetyltransferase-like isoleucine patch superfamily enzyme